tara:strand:- start:198 stop:602 length:405 start_codon:yes stop_codon:yes gene_type:complete
MDIQYSLFDEQLPFEEGTEYTANQITDKIKWYYNNKPFYAMNNTKETTDRIYFCDFKPRNRYIYNGKWRKIKNKRELSPLEKSQFLNVYDKNKHQFRKIDLSTLSYLRVGKYRFRVDQVKDVESFPRVMIKRLP